MFDYFLPLLWDVLLDVLLDTVKALPFLFLAYLLIEWLEERTQTHTIRALHSSGPLGPVIGAVLGVVPQCGFSAAASNLYAGGIISRGALIAVFLSTSDEMLPILISRQAPLGTIAKILIFKLIAGMLVGLLLDLFGKITGYHRDKDIHDLCEQEGCRCEEGIWVSAIRHTIKIATFLLLFSFVLTLAIELIGTDSLSSFILNRPIIGELLSGLIGLIPNCAGSVIITDLFLEGGLSAGAMLSGLLVGSGVGLLILFRANHNLKENLTILGWLYASGVIIGMLSELLPIF